MKTDWITIINSKPTIMESMELIYIQNGNEELEILKCLIDDSRIDVVYLRYFLQHLHWLDFDNSINGVLPFEYCIKKGNLVFLVEIINYMLSKLYLENLIYHFSYLVDTVMIEYINNKELPTEYRNYLGLYRADVIDCIQTGSRLVCLIPERYLEKHEREEEDEGQKDSKRMRMTVE